MVFFCSRKYIINRAPVNVIFVGVCVCVRVWVQSACTEFTPQLRVFAVPFNTHILPVAGIWRVIYKLSRRYAHIFGAVTYLPDGSGAFFTAVNAAQPASQQRQRRQRPTKLIAIQMMLANSNSTVCVCVRVCPRACVCVWILI